MMDIKLFCFSCMEKLDDPNQICPTCGHDNHIRTNAHDQLPNSVVGKRYLIGHALGRGGFGITYIGRDLMLNRKIAVKEFFPHNLVTRMTGASTIAAVDDERGELFARGKIDALQEAQIIAKLGQIPHTVSVHDIFEANNSFYIVMEYIDGLTLRKYVEKSGGKLTPKEALDMLRPLFPTLSRVHRQGVIHRDISPDNIMVRGETDEVVLLDFGAARIVDEQEETLSINPVFRSGYAPMEQYIRRVRLTPRTDEYALCATLFFCMTGQKPQDAQERAFDEDHLVLPEDVACQFKPHQLEALTKGLSLKAADRYETIAELEEALYQKSTNQPEQEQKKSEVQKKVETGETRKTVPVKQPTPLLKRKAVIILAAVCVVVIGVLTGIGVSILGRDEQQDPQTLYTLGDNYENGLNEAEQDSGKAAESIEGLPQTIDLNRGQTERLTPKVEPSSAMDILSYSTSDEKIVTVDADGHLTAIGPGRATVKVTCGNLWRDVTVIVSVPTESISIQADRHTLNKGNTLTLTPAVLPSDTTDALQYESDHPDIASVTGKGEVTALAAGTATITITSGNVAHKVKVEVAPPPTPTPTATPKPTATPAPTPVTSITIKGEQYSTSTTSLTLVNKNLTSADIEPLKYLTNLTHLDLSVNQITDISALRELTNLTTLDLLGNQITDISVLRGLTNLEDLRMQGNQIADISALRELTNLTCLYLPCNQITDISALRKLTNLTELSLPDNQITDISALRELTNLKQLYLQENNITDISALRELTNLTYVVLRDNQITDWSPVRHVKNVSGRPE